MLAQGYRPLADTGITPWVDNGDHPGETVAEQREFKVGDKVTHPSYPFDNAGEVGTIVEKDPERYPGDIFHGDEYRAVDFHDGYAGAYWGTGIYNVRTNELTLVEPAPEQAVDLTADEPTALVLKSELEAARQELDAYKARVRERLIDVSEQYARGDLTLDRPWCGQFDTFLESIDLEPREKDKDYSVNVAYTIRGTVSIGRSTSDEDSAANDIDSDDVRSAIKNDLGLSYYADFDVHDWEVSSVEEI